jgi:uncharacterized protein (UPF0276 family)
MIRLAANWSQALEKLLRKVHPPVDFLKIPLERDARAQLAQARGLRPVLLHGWGPPYRVGMSEIPAPDELRELILTSGTPYLSVHLDVQPEDFEGEISPERALERVRTSVQSLREITNLEILLENMPTYAWSERPRFVTNPEFIAAALERSGAGFLLDIAHARVAAHHRRQDALAYLNSLPLERALEIHVSGPRLEHDGLRDRHLPMTDTDYALLEGVLERAKRVQTITLEYGGIPDAGKTRDGLDMRFNRNDPAALLEQLGRLDTIRKRVSGTLRTAPTLPQGWHLDRRRRASPDEISQGSIRALGY